MKTLTLRTLGGALALLTLASCGAKDATESEESKDAIVSRPCPLTSLSVGVATVGGCEPPVRPPPPASSLPACSSGVSGSRAFLRVTGYSDSHRTTGGVTSAATLVTWSSEAKDHVIAALGAQRISAKAVCADHVGNQSSAVPGPPTGARLFDVVARFTIGVEESGYTGCAGAAAPIECFE